MREDTIQVVMPVECTNCKLRERCGVCAAACLAETGATTKRPEYICRMTHEQERMTYEKYGKCGGNGINES